MAFKTIATEKELRIMGDIGDLWRETKQARKAERKQRKESNYSSSVQMLVDNGIGFEDKGYHLVVKHKGMIADFWPTTGKFNIRKTPKYKRGVRMLIKLLRGDYSENDFKSITGGF
ncbi:hypothetical protein BA3_0038 [Thalassomonas phage BA3]|uniref:hypothetical protein n=1 Tax=Thalassomonas phage BA3 TaxID=469660 RepID=UPI00015D95B5|nr:hypothetical protein BA3_0038 [Thalassomonas phage BA3]ABV74323.1 hypothetical protein BA3_0038 [Thalassomonas phage BA3]